MIRLYDFIVTATFLLALFVIVLGAYTRLTDAGLGCPDWPGCYGKLFVPDKPYDETYQQVINSAKAWTEMIHRYAAGTLGLFILVILIMSIECRKLLGISLSIPILLMITVIFQGLLGMWTVTHLLSPTIVTAHLIGGFTTLSLIFILLLKRVQLRDYYFVTPWFKLFSMLALIAVIIQITLGGWTSTNYAALGCGVNFPLCIEQWIPNLQLSTAFDLRWNPGTNYEFGTLDADSRATIHFTHRVGAILVALTTIPLAIYILISQTGILQRVGFIILAIVSLQITLGILNVVWVLPLWTAVLHNLVAALTLLSLITLNFIIIRE